MKNITNKLKNLGKIIFGAGALTTAFFVGRETKEIPETAIDVFREGNRAYLVRLYNSQEGRSNGLEIREENEAINYSVVGTKEYNAKKSFEEKNPNLKIHIEDIDGYKK